jgi:hypothetical protein
VNIASIVVAAVAQLALSACATGPDGAFPHGPPLTYEQLLPNTHENPAWARNAQQNRAPQAQPAPQGPDAASDRGGTPAR